jgi:transcriptional regulator with GAF, ATPase, and Fis domain
MPEGRVPEFPPRYEAQRRLGAGAGGEVWCVRDRVGGRVLALKLLAADASEVELEVLVREASALSGLEGLGVPGVVAFGAMPGGRRFMLREMVEGTSLDEALSRAGAPWLEALASACDQLTVVHRAGLLHGDLKPANVIVGEDGRGTLVDLGLAAAWKEGGPAARGLTPRYAAPEVLHGEAPSARAEVYALGVSLKEGLARRRQDLAGDAYDALSGVAARATEPIAAARWPSVDEFATALRRAAGLRTSDRAGAAPWPVVGIEAAARDLLERTLALGPGAALAVDGPRGSGRSTLARRLAWTLGAQGHRVAVVDAPEGGAAMREALELELAQHRAPIGGGAHRGEGGPAYLVIDDVDKADDGARATLREASRAGARVVAVGSADAVGAILGEAPSPFAVPRLEIESAVDLVARAIPSLPPALREHLVERAGGRPGALRAAVGKLEGKTIVSREDIDEALSGDSMRPRFDEPAAALDWADRALDVGRFDEAASVLDAIAPERPAGPDAKVRLGIARARVAIGRGDPAAALAELESVGGAAQGGALQRPWQALRARALVRAGRFAEATTLADAVTAEHDDDAVAADALSTRGVALAFTGDDAAARPTLDRAIALAKTLGDPRTEAIARGSSAIAYQRAGKTDDARAAYEASLAAAERARDAGTLAAMRLNLAGLLQSEGHLAEALRQLESAVDLGQRAGSGAAVIQARLNLASLDLYLGRWARARESIDLLTRSARSRGDLSAGARAQLLGLEAEYAARTGEGGRKPRDLYEEAAKAWAAQGRGHDAAEARIEGLLAAVRAASVDGPARAEADAPGLARDLEAIRATLGESGFGEHAALAELVRGTIARLAGDEERSRRALDAAVELARKAGRREWAWQALDARARLATAQGALATARRDNEAALAMLEETATHLPRDLREVFWNDPRRRALRQARPAAPDTTMISTGAITVASTEDRLARVLEVTRELATEHDMPRLLQRVTDHAVALLGAERGFVLLFGEAGELEAHTARTRSGGDDPHGRFSRSVADRVLESGEPVVTISAREDERLAEAISVHQLMIQSIACVPIRGAPPVGRTIGALYVETRLRPGVRFERELPTLRAFADQVAIAIENARLLSENLARADQLARANVDLATARDELARTLGKRTEQLAEARRDLKQVRAELRGHFGYGGLVGTSTAMRRLYAIVDRVKDTDVAVLITGESGTGKEMVARVVHQAGPRGKKPFIGVNCGAIPANLLESELFGSVRGAFTGADQDRRGLFREADGGTILLDEIGEMPAKMQTGLLRVLQERQVRPLGGTREEPVDVRVMAATHCDLEKMVEEGTFRRDLYYRLHVVEMRVPPLRERAEDIPPLVDHFLARMSARYRRDRKGLSREALRALCAQPWPGNVRQLEHVLLNAWLMSEGKEIDVDDFELPSMQAARANGHASARPRRGSAAPRAQTAGEHKAAERERILGALTACNWNRAQAAKMIGVPRRTFYRRLREFGLL